MAVEIVRIDEGNMERLTDIAPEVFDYAIDARFLSRFCASPQSLLYVAIADGAVVGQARAYVHLQPDSPDQLYIDNLGVTPAWRRQGVATELVRALLDEGAARGCEQIWLATESDNAEARGFYRSLGLFESEVAMFANFSEEDG
jgi:ribosomal protein S18 acetylase RimI-like enzyme